MKMPPSANEENKLSKLLTHDENQQISKLLGNRCQAICTTVVQLFCTEPPHHTQWIKKDVGVLCFVKDHIKKNYFFRIFCLQRNTMLWEHEMYNNMEYIESTSFLHMFEGENCIVAFNFACTDDAKEYRLVVDQKIQMRRKKEERRSRQSKELVTSIPKVSMGSNQESFNQRKFTDPAAKAAKRKRNITKADIGCPSDFKHVTHVGFHPDSGFDIDSEDSQMKHFFEKAGVSEKQLQDRDTREFIYDFINTYGGAKAVVGNTSKISSDFGSLSLISNNNTPLPPVPPRGAAPRGLHVRAAPPPPPPPPSSTGNHNSIVRPQFATNNYMTNNKSNEEENVFTPPCPPPPPLPMSLPPSEPYSTHVAPPPLPQLGVVKTVAAAPDDSRNDLLSEIRKGLTLKPVCEREIKPGNPVVEEENSTDLAKALSRALAERSKAIHSEDDDDDEDDSNDDEWE